MEIRFAEPLSEAERGVVLASAKIRRWLDRIATAFTVGVVSFDKVYFFGSRLGFVMARAEVRTHAGDPVPSLAFLRGDGVAVLPILRTPDGVAWTVLTRQPRLAVGEADAEEIPAGMVDEGDPAAKAIEELREDLGEDLGFTEAALVHLETVAVSSGGTDEAIVIFAAETDVSHETLGRLAGRVTGNHGEHEHIRLEVIRFEDLAFRGRSDMKTRLAYYAYLAHLGRCAPPPSRG